MSKTKTLLSSDEKGMLRSMFKRSWLLFSGFNMVNYQGLGYGTSMVPAIKLFYKKDSEEEKKALARAVQFFNCTYETAPFIMGLNAAMEKENAEVEDFDTESISATKAALMGPLSAIGDSIFWGVIRTVAAAIAIPLAVTGNILGPLLFIIIFHAASITTRYQLLKLGYTSGTKFLHTVGDSGLMKNLTYCVSIVGMIMVGSMVAQFVDIKTPLEIAFSSGETMIVQEILDSIFLGILPICFTFGFFALLRRKMKITHLVIGCMVLGFVFMFTGILMP